MRKFYEIKAKAGDRAEVWIYEQIGEDWFGEGLTAKNFVQELAALDVTGIDLHINSPGGSVFDGQAIYNAIKRHPADVTTYVDGIAASIASVIALAGDRVIMADNALFMIHNPFGGCMGTAEDMRSVADVLDKVRDTIVGVYQEKTGKTADELMAAMDAETWMDAAQARDFGFADELAPELALAAGFDLSMFKNPPQNVGKRNSAADTEKLTQARDLIDEAITDEDAPPPADEAPGDVASDVTDTPVAQGSEPARRPFIPGVGYAPATSPKEG